MQQHAMQSRSREKRSYCCCCKGLGPSSLPSQALLRSTGDNRLTSCMPWTRESAPPGGSCCWDPWPCSRAAGPLGPRRVPSVCSFACMNVQSTGMGTAGRLDCWTAGCTSALTSMELLLMPAAAPTPTPGWICREGLCTTLGIHGTGHAALTTLLHGHRCVALLLVLWSCATDDGLVLLVEVKVLYT